MANNKKNIFFCQNCGFESTKWLGQCPACHEWNSFVEGMAKPISNKAKKIGTYLSESSGPTLLKDINIADTPRISTNIAELDRVLGGGMVQGSLILIGGEPGIGKSTLLMQACLNLSIQNKFLYVSGEESPAQIKDRAIRLGNKLNDNLMLLCDNNFDNIILSIDKYKPNIVVIDSIQTMISDNVTSASGSVTQIREVTANILKIAKDNNITFFIIGHVTKEGMVAGPKVLEHMVDTVLYFEGDNHLMYRILRSVKNRFGASNEIGLFEMTDIGLVEVNDPSGFMINGSDNEQNNNGTAITCTIEGSRALLVEIQALVSDSVFQIPRRTVYGIDYNRANLLIAVLEKRANIKLVASDVYINVAGGFKLNEPAVDLAIISAIISSYKSISLPKKSICFGEVGLSGEVRKISRATQRVTAAVKLGFDTIILPNKNCSEIKTFDQNIKIIGIKNIEELMDIII